MRGFDQKKENYYPSPKQLWDYFYCGIIPNSNNSLFLQELDIQYDIVGYQEDESFNGRVLHQIENLVNLKRFAISYKLKQNLQVDESIAPADVQQAIKSLHNVISTVIKRGHKQIESFVGKIILNKKQKYKILNVQFNHNQNNNTDSRQWENAVFKLKNKASHSKKCSHLEQVETLLNTLHNNIFNKASKLKISIEYLAKEHPQAAPYSTYKQLFSIYQKNNQIKNYSLVIREDSFHLNMRKKANIYSIKYIDTNNIAKIFFNCSERMRSLKLSYHFLDTLLLRNHKLFPKNTKSFVYNSDEINNLIKYNDKMINQQNQNSNQQSNVINVLNKLSSISEESTVLIEESTLVNGDRFINNQESAVINEGEQNESEFDENTNSSKPFFIQNSIQKPPSFIFDKKHKSNSKIQHSSNSLILQSSNSQISQSSNCQLNSCELKSEIDEKSFIQDVISSKVNQNQKQQPQQLQNQQSLQIISSDEDISLEEEEIGVINEREKYLLECSLEIDCIDSFDRYQDFLLNNLSTMVSQHTNTVKIIIRDCKFFEKNESKQQSGNNSNISIQNLYQSIFQKILSRMKEWPRQQVNFQIFQRKVCQYALLIQKNYFQICNIALSELINVEMSINSDKYETGQRSVTELMLMRMEAAKWQRNTVGRTQLAQYERNTVTQNIIVNDKDIFGIIFKMNKNLISLKNEAFTQEFQRIIHRFGYQLFELHIQYQSFENQYNSESILSQLLQLGTQQISCVYVNLYQQKSHSNINQNFFIWLDTLIQSRYPEEMPQSLELKTTKENSKKLSKKSFQYKPILVNSDAQASTVMQFNVQDIQMIFKSNRELKITKWLDSNSNSCEKEIINVLDNKFGNFIKLITSSSTPLNAKADSDVQTLINSTTNAITTTTAITTAATTSITTTAKHQEDFEINFSNNLAIIVIRGTVQSNQSIMNSQSNINNSSNIKNQYYTKIQSTINNQQNLNNQIVLSDNNQVRSGLCLHFGRIYSKVKKIHVNINPKSAAFQKRLANTLSKLNEFDDLKIIYQINSKANWDDYTLIEFLGAVPAKMLHVVVMDEEKDLKFLDQSKRIFHNLLNLNNLITFQIKVEQQNDESAYSKYKSRHFEFMMPFLYIPKQLLHLQVLTPHKNINQQYNFNKRYLLVLSIKALHKRKIYRKDILSQVFEFYL